MEATPHRLSELIRQDLVNISKNLPEIGISHLCNLLWYYENGGWDWVDSYIDCVTEYHATHTRPNKALGETIYQKWADCMDNILSWCISAKTWLNR